LYRLNRVVLENGHEMSIVIVVLFVFGKKCQTPIHTGLIIIIIIIIITTATATFTTVQNNMNTDVESHMQQTSVQTKINVEKTIMKKCSETQTLRAGCSKAEPKKFRPAADPFPGARDGQN